MEAFTQVTNIEGRSGGSEKPEMAKVLEKDYGYEDHGTYLIENKQGRKVEILGKSVVRAIKIEGAKLVGLVCHGPEYEEEKRAREREEDFLKRDLPDPETLPVVEGEERAEPKEEPEEPAFKTDLDKELDGLAGPAVGEPELPKKKPARKDGKPACTYVDPDGSRCKGIALKGSDRCRHHPHKAKAKRKRKQISVDDVLAVPPAKKRQRKK